MSKRRLIKMAGLAVLSYGLAWAMTAVVGCPQLEAYSIDAMREQDIKAHQRLTERLIAKGVDPSEISDWDSDGDPENDPSYFATASSPAPFIVLVDHGVSYGLLCGHGGERFYFWLLGFSWHVSSGEKWIS